MATAAAAVNAMRHAIALSAHGLGTTSPNPVVGCVILDAAGDSVGVEDHAADDGVGTGGAEAVGGQGDRATHRVCGSCGGAHGPSPPAERLRGGRNESIPTGRLLMPTARYLSSGL